MSLTLHEKIHLACRYLHDLVTSFNRSCPFILRATGNRKMIASISLIFFVWVVVVAWIAYKLSIRCKVLDAFLNALEMKSILIKRQKNHAIALPHADYMKEISELDSAIDGFYRMNDNMKDESEAGFRWFFVTKWLVAAGRDRN